jgi:NTP pyrophosphatase (non-canonical NTP hydrolase)
MQMEMEMQTQTQNFVKQVGEWADKNFGEKQNPWLGMVEETGEIAHCLLKRFQRIRGFENEAFFKEQLIDALGDLGIYAAHYAYVNGVRVYLGFEEHMHKLESPDNILVGELLYRIAALGDLWQEEADIEMQFNLMTRSAKTIALKYDIDFHDVVMGTWEKIVRKRNWIDNPLQGTINEPTSDSTNPGGIENRKPATDPGSTYGAKCVE